MGRCLLSHPGPKWIQRSAASSKSTHAPQFCLGKTPHRKLARRKKQNATLGQPPSVALFRDVPGQPALLTQRSDSSSPTALPTNEERRICLKAAAPRDPKTATRNHRGGQ